VFLASLGITLEGVDSWAIDRMMWMLDEQHVHAGDTLFSEGQPCDFLYFMRQGKVRLTREGAAPWTLDGRWFLGVFEAFGDRAYARTATALTDFEAMRVPSAAWIDLFEDSFQLARTAIENIGRGVSRLEERLPVDPPRIAETPPGVGTGPLSLVERLGLLVNVRMFRGGGVQALAELAAASVETSFLEGQVVLDRGVERRQLHLVVEGEVVARRTNPEVSRHYRAGDIVCGPFSFGSPALAWEARAASPVRILSLSYDLWIDLMEEHFDLLRAAMNALGRRRDLLLECLADPSGGLTLT
jgi:CRP-like cAMP-binding protein